MTLNVGNTLFKNYGAPTHAPADLRACPRFCMHSVIKLPARSIQQMCMLCPHVQNTVYLLANYTIAVVMSRYGAALRAHALSRTNLATRDFFVGNVTYTS